MWTVCLGRMEDHMLGYVPMHLADYEYICYWMYSSLCVSISLLHIQRCSGIYWWRDTSNRNYRESRWFERGVRQALQIHSRSPSLNWDRGRHQSPHLQQPCQVSWCKYDCCSFMWPPSELNKNGGCRLKASHFQTLFVWVVGIHSL